VETAPDIPEKNECAAQCRWSAHGRTAGLRAGIRLARSRYFALVFCGDTGLQRGSVPGQVNPRLGPPGASTSPESGLAVSNDV